MLRAVSDDSARIGLNFVSPIFSTEWSCAYAENRELVVLQTPNAAVLGPVDHRKTYSSLTIGAMVDAGLARYRVVRRSPRLVSWCMLISQGGNCALPASVSDSRRRWSFKGPRLVNLPPRHDQYQPIRSNRPQCRMVWNAYSNLIRHRKLSTSCARLHVNFCASHIYASLPTAEVDG